MRQWIQDASSAIALLGFTWIVVVWSGILVA